MADSCWDEKLDRKRERAPFNPTGQASNDITYDIKECMKENPRQVTVVDCLRSRQEFWDVYQIISNFLLICIMISSASLAAEDPLDANSRRNRQALLLNSCQIFLLSTLPHNTGLKMPEATEDH